MFIVNKDGAQLISRNHLMLCRICENHDATLKDIGQTYGIVANTVLKAIRKQISESGTRMLNGKTPRSIKEIRQCYGEYLIIQRGIDLINHMHDQNKGKK